MSEFTYRQDPDAHRYFIAEEEGEAKFIGWLRDENKYAYRPDIRDRISLEKNFREKFETLNRVSLTDAEFARLLEEITIADVFTAARVLRERNDFVRDDGTPLSYTLVNTRDWCKNDFEVVNQLRINTDNSHHRYDVILLINGVPVAQVELKAGSVSPRRAMEQIIDYKADPGNGYSRTLLCFIQLLIVSNGSQTFYFANNNARHFAFDADERFLPVYTFADRENTPVTDLRAFTADFLRKCDLGRTISRYMVLVASEQKLLMMRPYQVYAVKSIVERIEKNAGNGFIWHTTGSGKTLTSFKASTLLKDSPDIHKCLFVVDRKDLDRQTREEFNRFQEGCVEENTNTETLVRRLLSDEKADKVIVTTIQKLGLALDGTARRNYKERLESLREKRLVFIFDECHRSQFGNNHTAIKNFFPKSQLFGFTGTPIFPENSTVTQVTGEEASRKTTEDLFGECLHRYTITHAIEDRNVLRFHVDYYKPDDAVARPDRDTEMRTIVGSILDKHDAATHRRRFNAIFATASINDAIAYHRLFDEIQAERAASGLIPLNIACVFSPPAGDDADVRQLQEDLPQETEDNKQDPDTKKKALREIIDAYNTRYGTNHTVAEFDLYYQDVQKRIKDRQFPNADLPRKGAECVDIVIVVDMLLTGFDSKYLNTLYVDKNLKYHGLIQAFSRTNRVLNAGKPHGHIIDYRAQQDAVNDAIILFSGIATGDKAREIWLVDPAPKVVEKLKDAHGKLAAFMKTQGLETTPEDAGKLRGDEARAEFIRCFREVQKLKTQLDQYTDLAPEQEKAVSALLPEATLTAFRSVYLETARRLRDERDKPDAKPIPEVDSLDFEFILFASADIDYDYIMRLIEKFSAQPADKKLKLSREQLIGLIQGDAKFIDEREMLTAYVGTLEAGRGLDEKTIRADYLRFKTARESAEITELAARHGLTTEPLQAFVKDTIDREIFDGERLTEILAPLGLGWRDRRVKELALMDDLFPLLVKRAAGREIAGLDAYKS